TPGQVLECQLVRQPPLRRRTHHSPLEHSPVNCPRIQICTTRRLDGAAGRVRECQMYEFELRPLEQRLRTGVDRLPALARKSVDRCSRMASWKSARHRLHLHLRVDVPPPAFRRELVDVRLDLQGRDETREGIIRIN